MTSTWTAPAVARWADVSAALAPVALIGGWTVGAAVQDQQFDSVRQTISALAAHGAQHRWIMTTGLATLGVCHLTTAAGVRAAATGGRVTLALGGLATVAVAASPQPHSGSSSAHLVAAAIGFGCLSAWPALAGTNGADAPRLLTRRAGFAASGVLSAVLIWFGVTLFGGSAQIGLAERILAGSQALWPLAVVLSRRRVSS